MIELTATEAEVSRCQIGTLKRGEHIKYLPYAFTEQGVAMLSSVSIPIAIGMDELTDKRTTVKPRKKIGYKLPKK